MQQKREQVVSCSPASGSSFGTGTTTVTCTATDANSNHTSTSFDVTVSQASVPSAPRGLAVYDYAITASTVHLAWFAPSDDGGSPVTGYKIQYRKVTTPAGQWSTFGESAALRTVNGAVTGLNPSTAYQFQVAAVNDVGTGPYSNRASATTEQPSCPGHQHAVNGQCEDLSCPTNYYATNNACDPGSVTVSGYVFRDADRDGIKDAGESGVSGVAMKAFAGGYDNGVLVTNNTLKSAVTASDGSYTLSDIPTGSDWVLVQIIQDGTQVYTTPYSTTILGTVNSGTTTLNVGLR